jgi:hypothetical protein
MDTHVKRELSDFTVEDAERDLETAISRMFFAEAVPLALVDKPLFRATLETAVKIGAAGYCLRSASETKMEARNAVSLPKNGALGGRILDNTVDYYDFNLKCRVDGLEGVKTCGLSCSMDKTTRHGFQMSNLCYMLPPTNFKLRGKHHIRNQPVYFDLPSTVSVEALARD